MSKTDSPQYIRKRDGRLELFDPGKIARALSGAMREVGKYSDGLARTLTDQVAADVSKRQGETTVEGVQDTIEAILVHEGLSEVAKAYILYRQRHSEARRTKAMLGVVDDLKLSVNAVKVLEKRYLLKDDTGAVIETPRQMFRRVAGAVAESERNYGGDVEATEEAFLRMLCQLEFLPNSPTLMNAGTGIGQLAACFVLPVGDSIVEIFEAVKNMAVIHQSGGGTGFSFSNLRPADDVVRSTGGIASGPLSFMRVFDITTDVIRQGGRRRGANMAIMRVDHPDVLEFITSKAEQRILTNFNISVAVTDEFLEVLDRDGEYELRNPRTGKPVRKVKAADIWNLIVMSAWRSGDPGVLFIDRINRDNPTPAVGQFQATNPCGEQPLLPYESCNLGSINLYEMLKDGEIDWDKLGRTVDLAVRFLDNVIDASHYPLPQIVAITRANRKIGLGVMGWAQLLIALGIPYDSDQALALAEKVMGFINERGHEASAELAKARGPFPNFQKSRWAEKGSRPLRNATVTTVAPTGTISIIAGVSSGIEPLFALCYFRTIAEGALLLEQNEQFEQVARQRGFYSHELMTELVHVGTVQKIPSIPEDVRRLFVTATDVSPEWHVRMQAAFQKHTDNAVSKTINLPADAAPDAVRHAYELARKLGCKGITVFRYGSVPGQPLAVKERSVSTAVVAGTPRSEGIPVVNPEFSGECRRCEP